MAITLVGVFDERSDAERACDRLEQEGIPRSAMHITANDTMLSTDTETHEDHRGFFARLFGLDETDDDTGDYAEAVRRGSCILGVTLMDEDRVEAVKDALSDSGAIDISRRAEQWRTGGYKGYDATAPRYTAAEAAKERETFKVMQEELQVGKREVTDGIVRVRRYVTEQPVSEQVTLREETVVVERNPVNREASSADMQAFGAPDKEIEIRHTREEPVVSKTARVVEEVEIGRQASERTETVSGTVRRSDVDVENVDDVPERNRPATAPEDRTGGRAGMSGTTGQSVTGTTGQSATAGTPGSPGISGLGGPGTMPGDGHSIAEDSNATGSAARGYTTGTGDMRRYSGPERRSSRSGSYTGVERRAHP